MCGGLSRVNDVHAIRFTRSLPTDGRSTGSDRPTGGRDPAGDARPGLLGATGTGKTFSMANIITRLQKPALVMAHNKTLAAQLYAEFKEFFPNNEVEYFVSYYDYYQPEAYVPRRDLYIEKETDINEEIERLRLAGTAALMSRRDVIIVASVSCIYGLGSPEEYSKGLISLKKGEVYRRNALLRQLIESQYQRNDLELKQGAFRVRGDTLEIYPAYEDKKIYRFSFFGDEVERIQVMNPVSGEILDTPEQADIYPAKHFITAEERLRWPSRISRSNWMTASPIIRRMKNYWKRSALSSAPVMTWKC